MKSQWDCVLENLGEWVGYFTTVTAQGESIEDIPSIIKLAGVQNNQAIHLNLTRFYPLPNSTERYPKEVVWNFSTPPGVGAIYFETGAFSSGTLAINIGVKTIAEFSLISTDRRFRVIQMFDINPQLDRVIFVREQRQGTSTPERPHLNFADLLGRWQGTSITLFADDRSTINIDTDSTFTIEENGYQLIEGGDRIPVQRVTNNDRLLEFNDSRDSQSYQTLLLPDGGYVTTPSQIKPGHAFFLEIGWIYQSSQRQRLVRRYDQTGKWESVTFIMEEKLVQ